LSAESGNAHNVALMATSASSVSHISPHGTTGCDCCIKKKVLRGVYPSRLRTDPSDWHCTTAGGTGANANKVIQPYANAVFHHFMVSIGSAGTSAYNPSESWCCTQARRGRRGRREPLCAILTSQ
jgi:hypothetical protein